MQSWGTRSRFVERDTELEPSKSGVIGLLCAALGRPRAADVSDLASLHLGIRADHEGNVARDYHTAGGGPGGGIIRASGSRSKDAVLSNRYYLAGADFLAGLEHSDEVFLREIQAALQQPRWQLFLGRKSFLPSPPVHMPDDGIRHLGLKRALTDAPWPLPCAPWRPPASGKQRLRLVMETTFDDPDAQLRQDQPIGAAFATRTFGPRAIRQEYFEKESTDVAEPAHP